MCCIYINAELIEAREEYEHRRFIASRPEGMFRREMASMEAAVDRQIEIMKRNYAHDDKLCEETLFEIRTNHIARVKAIMNLRREFFPIKLDIVEPIYITR